jgi:hypothetical protein
VCNRRGTPCAGVPETGIAGSAGSSPHRLWPGCSRRSACSNAPRERSPSRRSPASSCLGSGSVSFWPMPATAAAWRFVRCSPHGRSLGSRHSAHPEVLSGHGRTAATCSGPRPEHPVPTEKRTSAENRRGARHSLTRPLPGNWTDTSPFRQRRRAASLLQDKQIRIVALRVTQFLADRPLVPGQVICFDSDTPLRSHHAEAL